MIDERIQALNRALARAAVRQADTDTRITKLERRNSHRELALLTLGAAGGLGIGGLAGRIGGWPSLIASTLTVVLLVTGVLIERAGRR